MERENEISIERREQRANERDMEKRITDEKIEREWRKSI